jgi:hypothetical protein
VKSGPGVANAASDKTIQHAKIRGVSIWFYIIAALQLLSAYQAYQSGSDALAAAGATIAVVDVLIGAAFVVLGYFAGQKHPWAFLARLASVFGRESRRSSDGDAQPAPSRHADDVTRDVRRVDRARRAHAGATVAPGDPAVGA